MINLFIERKEDTYYGRKINSICYLGNNRALGILWCVYGVWFTLIGLPLLAELNSGLVIIPILGAVLIGIAAMVVYAVVDQRQDYLNIIRGL